MKKWTGLIAAGVMLVTLPWVQAADYYASSIHPNRSDSHTGTSPDAPWASFDKVKSEWNDLSGGDTVHLERGSTWNLSFSEDYWYMSSGGSTSEGYVTIRGDDYGTGNKPILKRTSGNGSSAFFVIQKSYITLRDFELDGGHSNYGKNTLGIAIGDDNADMSHVNIQNMKIHNLGGNSGEYICGIWVVTPGYTVSDCLIEGNEVSDYSAHGLNHYSQGPMINITWRNNIVRNSYTGGRYPDANSALQICSGSKNCVFEYNYLEDTTTTEGCILAFGKYTDDTGFNQIRYNIIPHSGEYGILFTVDHNNRKLLYDIYGNVMYDNDRSGLAIHPYNSYAAGTTFRIYNNTFINNYTDGGTVTKGEAEFDNLMANTTISFANNLISHPAYGDSVGLAIDDGFNGSFSHNNNLYWHQGGTSRNIVRHNSTYSTANVLQYEPSAKNQDPQLANTLDIPTTVSSSAGALPKGLLLVLGSPGVNAGADLGPAYAGSINNTPRPDGEWSIGAYQYTVLSHTPNAPQGLRIVTP